MVNILKEFILEAIKASSSYMKKERVRAEIQEMIIASVKSSAITDQKSLDEFFSTLDMAALALKAVPYEAYVQLAGVKKSVKLPHKALRW